MSSPDESSGVCLIYMRAIDAIEGLFTYTMIGLKSSKVQWGYSPSRKLFVFDNPFKHDTFGCHVHGSNLRVMPMNTTEVKYELARGIELTGVEDNMHDQLRKLLLAILHKLEFKVKEDDEHLHVIKTEGKFLACDIGYSYLHIEVNGTLLYVRSCIVER